MVAIVIAGNRNIAVLSPLDAVILAAAAEMEVPGTIRRAEHGNVLATVHTKFGRYRYVSIEAERLGIQRGVQAVHPVPDACTINGQVSPIVTIVIAHDRLIAILAKL